VVAAEQAGLDSVFVRRPHCPAVPDGVTPTHVVDGLDSVAALASGNGKENLDSEPDAA